MPFSEAEVVRSQLTEEQRVMPANLGTTQPEAELWTCSRWAVKLPHPVKLQTVSEQSSRYGRYRKAELFRRWSKHTLPASLRAARRPHERQRSASTISEHGTGYCSAGRASPGQRPVGPALSAMAFLVGGEGCRAAPWSPSGLQFQKNGHWTVVPGNIALACLTPTVISEAIFPSIKGRGSVNERH